MNIETLILSNLIFNEEYLRKVIPFLTPDYFREPSMKVVFEIIDGYVKKYNNIPSREAVAIELADAPVNTHVFDEAKNIIASLDTEKPDIQWLLNKTEEFCQEKAIYNAITKSVQILNDKNGTIGKGSIPKLLSDALSVSFDNHIGHDFIEDSEQRFDFYQRVESKIPFDLKYMNIITGGGLPKKTLNIALAGTGVGKSLFMCHCAAANITNGKNVLYITLEMAEERIAERIEANLLDLPLDELKTIPKEMYDRRFGRVKAKTPGRLIIKEYPTACAGSANFRHLLNELRLKKNFKPDIVYIDYLNICLSSRIKSGSNANSYTLIKAIAEELRGLAVEFDVPIVSATQTTRSGFSNSDVGLEDTSESFGLPATADFMFALITTEELQELNQMMVKQLKNRYNDPSVYRRFVIGVDRPKMRLYDVEQEAQDLSDGPVMDKTKFITSEMERSSSRPKRTRDFGGFE